MVLGLLILAGIPTTIAVAEGIAHQDPEEPEIDPKRMVKFHINVYCDAKSRSTKLVHGKRCVLRDNKVYIDEPNPAKRRKPSHTAEAFYIEYPDEDREVPVRGLVSSIDHDPPMLNWIYVDKDTFELKHSNRSGSREHHVGPWDWTEDEEGLTIEGVECFVAVEEKAGEWAVYYDKEDNRMKGLIEGKKVLPISLERKIRPEPATEPAKS